MQNKISLRDILKTGYTIRNWEIDFSRSKKAHALTNIETSAFEIYMQGRSDKFNLDLLFERDYDNNGSGNVTPFFDVSINAYSQNDKIGEFHYSSKDFHIDFQPIKKFIYYCYYTSLANDLADQYK